jgi:hypothetical protein
MRRRDVIAILSGATLSWSITVRGQQSNNQVRRIGLLMLVAETDPQAHAESNAFS